MTDRNKPIITIAHVTMGIIFQMRNILTCVLLLISALLFNIAATANHLSTDSIDISNSEQVSTLKDIVLSEVSVTTIKGGDHPNADEAVTYIGSNQVDTYDLVSLRDVSALAPNFYIPAYGSRMTSSIYVRGLGTRIDQPVVGLNIDNIPIINKDNFDFDMADIDRVEILRGPQNILYGRNTMGGLVNIYTLSPLSFQGARAKIAYGSQNSWHASAGIYDKITTKLGMSISGELSGTDGFFKNEYNNSSTGRENLGSVKWRMSFRPTEKVIFENTATLTRGKQHGYPYLNVAANRIAYNDTCYYERLSFVDGLTVKHTFKGITFSSIMSVQYLDDDMVLDQDFSPEEYFTLQQKRKEWAFTGDFVARGPQTGNYTWLGGLFGFYRRTRMNAPVTFKETGIDKLIEANRNKANPEYPIAWDTPSFLLGSEFTMPSGGLSIYHESAYKLGDFKATVGLRFDWEQTNLNYRSFCNTSYTVYDNFTDPTATPLPIHRHASVNIDEYGHISHDYTQLLPKVSLSYQLPEGIGNIFVSATKGYKSGGYNTQMFSDFLQQRLMSEMGLSQQYNVDETVSYKPETDWNFELGAHIQLLDRCMNIDFSAFWIEVDNQQITMFPEGSITGRIMANAGKGRSRGVELSTTYQAPAGWFIRGSYGYTNARFIDFNNGRADYSGKRIPYAPSNTIFFGAGYSHRFSGYFDSVSIQANTRGVGDIWWDEANTIKQPFYMLLNASIAATHKDFKLELWADNITDTQYATFYFVSIGKAFLQKGNGFSIGASISWSMDFE